MRRGGRAMNHAFNAYMKRLLIVDLYNFYNLGEVAQLNALINELRDFDFTVLSLCSYTDAEACKKLGVEVIGSLKPRKPILVLASKLLAMFLRAYLYRLFRTKFLLNEELNALLESDVIVRLGGEMYTFESIVNTLFHSYTLLLAKILGKQYVIISQSIGPIKRVKRLARYILNGAKLITVRDSGSYNFLINVLKIDESKVHMYPDAAFSLISNLNLPSKSDGESKIIGVNLSPITPQFMFRSIESIERKIELFADLMADILDEIAKNYEIALIPTVYGPGERVGLFKIYDDKVIMSIVLDRMQEKEGVRIIPINGLSDVIDAISRCNIFIGCRMHSLVFAISLGVPSINLAYGRKMVELYEQLDLSDFTVRLQGWEHDEGLKDEILSKFNSLLANYDRVKKTVGGISERLRREAAAHAMAIKWVYYMSRVRVCFGCGTCIAACPTGAIQMVLNNHGEWVPKPDFRKCKGCLRCITSCPALRNS